jgi:hypothetical protein
MDPQHSSTRRQPVNEATLPLVFSELNFNIITDFDCVGFRGWLNVLLQLEISVKSDVEGSTIKIVLANLHL